MRRQIALLLAALLCALLGLGGQTARAADISLLNYLVTDLTELELLLDDVARDTPYHITLCASSVGMPDVMKNLRLGEGRPPLDDGELLLVFIQNTKRAQIYTAPQCALPLTERDRKEVARAFAADGLTDTDRLAAGAIAMVNVIYRSGDYPASERVHAVLHARAPDTSWVVPALCALGGALVGGGVTAACLAARDAKGKEGAPCEE